MLLSLVFFFALLKRFYKGDYPVFNGGTMVYSNRLLICGYYSVPDTESIKPILD